MLVDRLRYELRILGGWIFAVPLAIMLAVTVLALLLSHSQILPIRIAQVLTGSIEMVLPLATTLLIANLICYDAAMELQLTLPRTFALTALWRLTLVVVWTAAISMVASTFIYHWKFLRIPAQLEHWAVIPQVLGEQLTWLAPLLWLVGAGTCLALLIRSRVASSALISGLWIVEAIFYGYFISYSWLKPFFLFATTLAPGIEFWFVNRYSLLGIALLLFLVDWQLLHNAEALLQGRAGEE
ncbi:hypothetical protein ccbrp13_29770 [Ktedonobacteria bacterium brp13]|nr:hypothetical protein ccbrp13_29770 [Ktedonobacteria bacterium brp13]